MGTRLVGHGANRQAAANPQAARSTIPTSTITQPENCAPARPADAGGQQQLEISLVVESLRLDSSAPITAERLKKEDPHLRVWRVVPGAGPCFRVGRYDLLQLL